VGISYKIDNEKGITYVLWDGIVTADQFLAHVRKLLSEPGWPSHTKQHLVDLNNLNVMSSSALDEATIEEATKLYLSDISKIGGLRVAIVAHEAFMSAKTFERLISKYHLITVIVFASLETACAWFGEDTTETRRKLKELKELTS
jgi:hypothetical protein